MIMAWRVPELAGLTRQQRKIFVSVASRVLLKEKRSATLVPLVLSCVGGVIGCLLCVYQFESAGVWVGLDVITSSAFCTMIGAAIGVMAGSLVGNAWLAQQLRPYLRKLL